MTRKLVDLTEHDFPLLLALSGGMDSTALATVVAQQFPHRLRNGEIIAAHFFHRIRSRAEEDEDLSAVSFLCESMRIALVLGERAGAAGGPPAAEGGAEASARAARYAFLSKAARASGARAIATAHHADDQVETLLMHMLDGSLGTMLAGIPARRDTADLTIVRPILTWDRKRIQAMLSSHGHEWSEDRTNDDLSIRRNLVRKSVRPLIENEWPALGHDLLVLAGGMRQVRERAERAAAALLGTARRSGGDGILVAKSAFFALDVDARLHFCYSAMTMLGLLLRRNRPAHAFFGPLLGSSPSRGGTYLEGRGLSVSAKREVLAFRRAIVP